MRFNTESGFAPVSLIAPSACATSRFVDMAPEGHVAVLRLALCESLSQPSRNWRGATEVLVALATLSSAFASASALSSTMRCKQNLGCPRYVFSFTAWSAPECSGEYSLLRGRGDRVSVSVRCAPGSAVIFCLYLRSFIKNDHSFWPAPRAKPLGKAPGDIRSGQICLSVRFSETRISFGPRPRLASAAGACSIAPSRRRAW